MRDHFPRQSPFSHFRGRCLEDTDAGPHSVEFQCFSCSTRASLMTLCVEVFEISITEPTVHSSGDRIYNVLDLILLFQKSKDGSQIPHYGFDHYPCSDVSVYSFNNNK